MRSTRLRAGQAAVLALAALVLTALAGCANAEPNVVAYVDGTKVTDRQLTDAVEGIESTLEPGQEILRDRVVNTLIVGVISTKLAAQNNITITDTDRDTLLRGSQLEPFLDVPKAKPVAYAAADQALVSKALGPEAYFAAVDKIPVTLNPRYGVLDVKEKTIVPGQTGSLALPLEPATPEAP